MPEIISNSEIQSYLDKTLTAEQITAFEQRLQQDSLAQQKLAEYQKIDESLKTLYQPVFDADIPSHLLNSSFQSSHDYLKTIAASIVFFCFGTIIGWQWSQPGNSSNDLFVQDLKNPALFAHTVFSVEKLHPVEVKADKQQQMNLWLSKRLKTTLNAPDLQQYQFALIGGRLLPSTRERMAAQYMYQDDNGNRITLYIKRGRWAANETAINHGSQVFNHDSFNQSFWIDGDLGFVLTGKTKQPLNQKLAESIYQQMSLDKQLLISLL